MDSAPHFAKLFAAPSVKIVVGKDDNIQVFHIPENALILHGSWFKSCLSNFAESQSREVCLPASIFLYWVFHGTLPTTSSALNASWFSRGCEEGIGIDIGLMMIQESEGGRSFLSDWLEAYLLAQFLMIDNLKDAVMERMCETAWRFRSSATSLSDADAVLAWNEGEEQLRRFVVDAVNLNKRSKFSAAIYPEIESKPDFGRAEGRLMWRRWIENLSEDATRIERWMISRDKKWYGESLFVGN
ncbi:hypothetical protein AC578_4678 [Pseudocercospora eumusae]|uniref:Uncharacterized protein n=1 Tax=Pseudocercospora eumusae TaxID=321146 RepID=A0A139H778_9PEZI|nr:hypothetical protein AC578_4678 [Pseudocercospora eumusae]